VTRIARARRLHVAGWTGPLVEDAEPDTVAGAGALDDGLNCFAQSGRRRLVRGGSRIALELSAVSGDDVTDVWGPFRYSASGAVVVGHVPDGPQHYLYALDDEMGFIAASEALSRGAMTWASATPARPLGVELFEKIYVVDGTTTATRQGMAVGVWAGGTWTVSQPTYDLDASGGSPGVLRAYCAEVFGGVLFVSGYDSESAPSSGSAPHLLRHSLLGTDPAAAGGFDANAYAIIGAKGQFIRAMKSGRTVLLVAKDSELYLISGAGRALPGWQYQIQPISNSLGAGCTNPYALDHAYGMWYGLGRVGPWRSDGGSVELLRAGRDRSWGRVQNLDLATVTAHPDRRQVWFGFHEVGRDDYETAPCTYWVWDIEREQWDVNQRTHRSFHYVGSVLQGAAVAPSSAPGAPVQDEDDGNFQFDTVEVTWTLTDATAQTEVWTRPASGGASSLYATIDAGVSRALIAGLAGATRYYVKLRNNLGGVTSEYSSETLVYTRLLPGRVAAGSTATTDTESARTIESLNVSDGATVTIDDNLSGGNEYTATYAAEPVGTRTASDTSPYGTAYNCATHHPDWPSAHDDALTTAAYQFTIGSPLPGEAAQDFSSGLLYETTLQVVFWPNQHGATYQFYTSTDGLSYTLRATQFAPTAGNPLAAMYFGMAVPTQGTKYYVKVRNSTTGSESSTVFMYTKLPAPATVAATSTGAGTPVVNVAVTPTQAGHKAYLYNADKTYEHTSAGTLTVSVNNFASTVGTCGQKDRYSVRTYNADWPAGFQYSAAVSDDVTNPCVVGS